MSFKGSSELKAAAFDAERDEYAQTMRTLETSLPVPFVKRDDGWVLFGPTTIRDRKRSYNFALQWLKVDKTLRVRVGCRFKTLEQAWKHWGPRPPKGVYRGASRRNECAQAIAIIRFMLLLAQQYNLLSMYNALPKFDSTIVRKRKRS